MTLQPARSTRAAGVALLFALVGCEDEAHLGYDIFHVACPQHGTSLQETKAHLGEYELDVVFTRASNYSCEIPATASWQITLEAREDDVRVKDCPVEQFPAWMHVTELGTDRSESLAVLLGENEIYVPDEAYHVGGIVPRLSSARFGFNGPGPLSIQNSGLSSVPTCCNDPVLGSFDPVAVLEAGPFEFQLSVQDRLGPEDALALSFDVNWGAQAACAFVDGTSAEIEVELYREDRLWASTTGMMTMDELGARWSLSGSINEGFASADGSVEGAGDGLQLDVFVPLIVDAQGQDVVICGSMELILDDGSAEVLGLAHGACDAQERD